MSTTTYQIPAHTFAPNPVVLCPVTCISNKTVLEYLQLILIRKHQKFELSSVISLNFPQSFISAINHQHNWKHWSFSNWNLLAYQGSGLVLHLTIRMQSPVIPSGFVCLEKRKHFWHIKLLLQLVWIPTSKQFFPALKSFRVLSLSLFNILILIFKSWQ